MVSKYGHYYYNFLLRVVVLPVSHTVYVSESLQMSILRRTQFFHIRETLLSKSICQYPSAMQTIITKNPI